MENIKDATRRGIPMTTTCKRLYELNFGENKLSYSYFWQDEKLCEGTAKDNFDYPAYEFTTICKELNEKITVAIITGKDDDKFGVKLEENGKGYVYVYVYVRAELTNQVPTPCESIYNHNFADACARLWIQLVEKDCQLLTQGV